MKRTICLVLSSVLLSILPSYGGSRSSADYSIPTDTLDSAGVNAQSANYSLRGSAVNEFGAANEGSITSTDYIDKPGYAGQLSDLLTLAVSRFAHGGAGTFDVNLPLNGPVAVECRSASIYTVVFTFANPLLTVASVHATATGNIQPGPASGQIDSNDPHNYIASLTILPNAQYITVTLGNVNDTDGNFSSEVPAVMGLLIGDTNANGAVNAGDVAQTKSRLGQAVDATNFRSDVIANGAMNAGDISIVKSNLGSGLP
jgi:hypothetical protein